jgi:hypothetical protein
MPTKLVCPICGKEFECNGDHEGPHDFVGEIVTCSPTKGAIHVFVNDNLNTPVRGVKVHCEKKGSGDTDGIGYAFFEQLDEDTYTTSVSLEDSDSEVKSDYYMTTRDSVKAKVSPGKITLVQFALVKYAPMHVVLERTDGEKELPRATFHVESDGHKPDPSSKEAEEGQADFEKCKPTESYTVRCELHEDDKKNFQLVKEATRDQRVTSVKLTTVVFQVEPRFWIDLVLEDPTDEALTGTFALHQEALESSASDVGRVIKHVSGLARGTVDVEKVTLSESREFESLT